MIAYEVAEQDLEKFAEAMDLDIDESKMSDEDLKPWKPLKEAFINAVMNKSLVVNDSGEPEFTQRRAPGETNAIVFHEPTGATLQAMDTKKDGQQIGKTFAALAAMTGTTAATFSKMKNKDLQVCLTIFNIFLG